MFKMLRAFEVPFRYEFKDPDTGYMYVSGSREGLFSQIISYRMQNGLEPIDMLEAVVENYWCGLPENAGKCCENRGLHRSFMGYVRGGVALLRNMLFPRYVSQEEADRRAGICRGCRYNVFPDRDFFLEWSDDIAVRCVGERRSKYHDELGNCEVCSCPLRAKVFWGGGLDRFSDEQVEKMRGVGCWQLELSGQG